MLESESDDDLESICNVLKINININTPREDILKKLMIWRFTNDDDIMHARTEMEKNIIKKLESETHNHDGDINSSDILNETVIIKHKKKNSIKKKIPKILKDTVWDEYIGRANGIGNCFVYNVVIDSKHFECGHVIAEKNGGEMILSNMRPVCEKCNKYMGTSNMMVYKALYNNIKTNDGIKI